MNETLQTRVDDEYRRYCRVCQQMVSPRIEDTDDENYHSDERDVSAIVCPNCEMQLGHCLWWPNTDR